MKQTNKANDALDALLTLMTRLRDQKDGCPWDKEQTFETIAPYTIEEAYEVADAIERGAMDELKDELGDLLFQVIFHTQMAKEQNLFTFSDVAAHITAKMIHRHPHVFGDEKAKSARDVEIRIWESRKNTEEKRQNLDSILDDVPKNLPALLRAQKLQKRAATVGFEWEKPADVLDKMEEEIAELREAIAGGRQDEILDELGDMFFVLTNFGRMLGANCEESLRGACTKFERRFKGMEEEFKENKTPMETVSLEEKEKSWQRQKQKERKQAV